MQTSPTIAASDETRPKNANKVELRGKFAAGYESRALREKSSALPGMNESDDGTFD